MRFHHLGLAARDPDRAQTMVEATGYACDRPVFDPLQRVMLRWCTKAGEPAIEIVSPADNDGPLANVLADHPTSFYHLCYEVEGDTAAAVEAMRAWGLRLVTVLQPTPAILFGGRLVSFHVVQGFGLVELLEPAAAAR